MGDPTGTEKLCADCGQWVERGRNGHWAVRTGTTLSFTCRSVIEEDEYGARLVQADYHYVEGEEQRHFPEPEVPRG